MRCLVGIVLVLATGALLPPSGPDLAGAHDVPHGRPVAKGRIDPTQSFPFAAISGAGGHFHELLVLPGLAPLLAGTHIGLFRSDDRGVTWRLAAARFSGVDIRGIVRDLRTGMVYVAARDAGILVSPDGTAWRTLAPRLPGRDVSALAIDPSGAHALYAWFRGRGLFQSESSGARWERLSGPQALPDVQSLAVHPTDSRRLYAGTDKGVWLSENGGRRWTRPAGALTELIGSVALPPWAPELLFAATVSGAFVGTAAGTGWMALPAAPAWWGPLIGFAFLPDQPGLLFAVAHEGVVAGRRLSDRIWTPVAELFPAELPPAAASGNIREVSGVQER